jgi:catechol 2,3-dioxygenase-like lactoylglutathione lyase family enzyme
MSAATTGVATQLQVTLRVADPTRSVHFYRILLGIAPDTVDAAGVRFALASPPLLLALVRGARAPGGALNHIGLRLPNAAALVEVQRRLEEAGIATQREEGVECCYARQTKFWVTDPDRNLWEIYTFHEDLDHSGFEDAPQVPAAAPVAVAAYSHRLTEPLPARINVADGSLDEVRLEGTFNLPLDEAQTDGLLAEVLRVLRPGGRVHIHALASDRPFPGKPALPGPAALVQRVPPDAAVVESLRRARFTNLFFDDVHEVTCFHVDGVELREIRLVGQRPAPDAVGTTCRVLYKGPLAQVTGDDGTAYRRGQVIEVAISFWESLRTGPAADQFARLAAS